MEIGLCYIVQTCFYKSIYIWNLKLSIKYVTTDIHLFVVVEVSERC